MIRTRFAPSPTGFLHIGGLRTALYAYAFAKNKDGRFVLRIEDTDQNRIVPGATEKIFEILNKFGLKWDELYVQSERVKTGIYQKYAQQLVKDGYAYYCHCPPQTQEQIKQSHQKKELILRDPCRNKKCLPGDSGAIRLRVPENEKVTFYDFVLKKEISWETNHVDEVMLLKTDGFPTYHLAVVVDDALMKISHIIRGRDWLPSTPIHLLLYKYLGFDLPQIGHLTDILDPAGGKLSKRKGSVCCEEFIEDGYLPEAILNFIMLLGWAPKDNREIYNLKDFVEVFDKGSLQTANPVFNRKKLDWFNGYYIRQKTDSELFDILKPYFPKGISDQLLIKTIPLVKERLFKLSDYTGMVGFLAAEPKVDVGLISDRKWLIPAAKELEKVDRWQAENLEKTLRNMAQANQYHLGKFFMDIRIAVTGQKVTPPLFGSLALLGKEKTLKRLLELK